MKTKAKYLGLILMLISVCCVFFACNNTINVQSISFKDEDIVILVGEEFTPTINVYPQNATNKDFVLTSLNDTVIVNGKTLKAAKAGNAIIKVQSCDDENIENIFTFKVVAESTTLNAPAVSYDSVKKVFNITPISNAESYTLKINDSEIELGEQTEYSLASYALNNSAFDCELSAKARANANAKSKAFLSSDFCEGIKIYQASEITSAKIEGGKLSFDGNDFSNFDVYINNHKIKNFDVTSNIELTDSLTDYAGQDVQLGVRAVFAGRRKDDVEYYESDFVNLPLYVVDVVEFSVKENMLNITPTKNADGYEVYLFDELIASGSETEYDLTSLKFNGINSGAITNLSVKAKINENSKNVALTSGFNTVKISRRADVNLTAQNNLISWQAGNSVQLTLLSEGANLFSTTTSVNSFNLNDYEAGSYTLKAVALGSDEIVYGGNDTVYYLPSNATEIEIVKQAKVELSNLNIQNQILTFAANENDEFKILLDTGEIAGAKQENTYTINFKTKNLSAGRHTVYVTRLGDNANCFDSDTSSVSFVQLEAILDAQITNGVVSFVRSQNNLNANISATITRDADSHTKDILVANNSFSIDSETDEFYAAGQYELGLFVKGDESNTFSVLTEQEIMPTVKKEFSVLACPTLAISGPEASNLTFESTGANSYKIFVDGSAQTLMAEQTSYNFNILNGQTKTYQIQAIGDGTATLNSKLSEGITISRLNAPILTYNYSENKLVVNVNNEQNVLAENPYTITLNWEEFDAENITTELNLKDGANTFTIYANAKGQVEDIYYLNSTQSQLEIQKLMADASYRMLDSYRLQILTSNVGNYSLLVNFEIDGSQHQFYENGNKLTCDELDVSLPIQKLGNRFIVDLLNNYAPILDVKTSLKVNVKFVSASSNYATSNWPLEASEIGLLTKATIARSGQKIVVDNVTSSSNALMLNGRKMDLTPNSFVENKGTQILIDIEYFNTLINGVNSLKVITLNDNDDALNLAALSEEFKFKRAEDITLTASKNNLKEDNSAYASFGILNYLSDAVYVVKITTSNGLELDLKNYYLSDAENEKISLKIDEILDELVTKYSTADGELIITVQALVENELEGEVYLFNSRISDELKFSIIAPVTNVTILNNLLTFECAQTNLAGFDVYYKTGENLTKLNTSILKQNQFELTGDLNIYNIVVRAIAKDAPTRYTNSKLSAVYQVIKTNKASLSASDGCVVVTLPDDIKLALDNEEIDINITITNGNKNLTFNLLDERLTTIENNYKYSISPYEILNYGNGELVKETLSVALEILPKPNNHKLYVTSQNDSFDFYGLLYPINISKTDLSGSENVYTLTWQPNEKNVLNNANLNNGYILAITYDDVTYYSTDNRLKYLNDGYKSYDAILTSNTINFPVGYDADGNGLLDNQELFNAGNYSVAVKVLPNELEGYNLCYSKFSGEFSFVKLKSPTIQVQNGVLIWEEDTQYPYATAYKLNIYSTSKSGTSGQTSYTTNSTSFDFADYEELNAFSGIYAITLQALSDDEFVLNSAISENFYVYRLPMVGGESGVSIDDGALILNSSILFSRANLEFEADTGHFTQTFYRTNAVDDYIEQYKGDANNWNEVPELNINILKNNYKIIVGNGDTPILNLLAGGSYTVNVQLFGNSNQQFAILNSAKSVNTSTLTINKLTSNTQEIAKGSYTYSAGNYEDVKYNHNFGNKVPVNKILETAPIYLLQIGTESETHYIYALDYYAFISAKENGTIDAADYEIFESDYKTTLGGLYATYKLTVSGSQPININIFYKNIINFKDYSTIKYYPIEASANLINGGFNYTQPEGIKQIDLSSGGVFNITTLVLGGDSDNNMGYLNANWGRVYHFVRYQNANLTSENGLLKFKDMQPKDDGVLDYPIYKLAISSISGQSFNIYLYYAGHEDVAREIANDSSAQFLPILSQNIVGGNILFDISPYLQQTSYTIKLRTLAGYGATDDSAMANQLLDAIEPVNEYTCYKLRDVQFSLTDGELAATLATTSDGETKVYNYEITVLDETNAPHTYTIDVQNDNNARIENGTLYYTVPSVINGFKLTPNKAYRIKICAIAKNNANLINGGYYIDGDADFTLTFKKADAITNVRVENGVLTWQLADSVAPNTKLKLKIVVDSIQIITQTLNRTTSYEFSDANYGNVILDGSQNLSVQLLVCGDNETVNSDYSSPLTVYRLRSVDTSSITAEDGVLTWAEVDHADNYTVTLRQNGQNYVYTTADCRLDLTSQQQTLPAGNYTVYIRANGSNYLNSITVVAKTSFTKLSEVIPSTIKFLGSQISWQAVSNAQGYIVEFSYNLNGDNATQSVVVTTASCTILDDINGQFSVSIKASGVGKSNFLNSQAVSVSFTGEDARPQKVGQILFNNTNHTFYWPAPADYKNGDSFVVTYSLTKTPGQQTETVTTQASGQYVDGGITYFYYEPLIIGNYSDFNVYVVRAGRNSATTQYGQTVNFNIFASGQGSADDPYIVTNETELVNIALKTDKHYKISNAISLTNQKIAANISNGYVIAANFSGSLDGGGVSLTLPDIALEDVPQFGLFKNLNNATISNLIVGTIQGKINVTLNLTASNEEVAVGLISVNSSNSSFTNVTINNSNITISGNASEDVYVSPLIAKSEGDTILGSVVKCATTLNTTGGKTKYVAGLIAKANNSKIDSSQMPTTGRQTNINFEATSKSTITYLGGAVAYFSASTTGAISNAQISVTFKNTPALNCAGILAYANGVNISGCTVSGNVEQRLTGSVELGGFAGTMQNANILNSNCNISFALTCGQISSSTHAGIVAGSILSGSTVSGCHSSTEINADATNLQNEVKLGKYGKSEISLVDIS